MAEKAPELPPQERLMSLDALRGFDMFWIIGGDAIGRGLKELADWPVFQIAARQLEHVEWNGMVFYDLIFPLFVFMMGVSLPFSFTKRLQRGDSRASLYGHLVRRAIILFALGVFYNNGFAKPWPDVRIAGVLPRIALCYLFGGLIYMNFKRNRSQVGMAVFPGKVTCQVRRTLVFRPDFERQCLFSSGTLLVRGVNGYTSNRGARRYGWRFACFRIGR